MENSEVQVDELEVNSEDVVSEEVNSEVVESPQYTELEQQAIEQGWDPKGKMGAEAWIVKGEMIKEKRAVQKDFQEFKKELENLKKLSYDKARKDLENELRKAVNNADYNQVQQIQKEMQGLPTPKEQPVQIPEVEDFYRDYPEIKNPVTADDFALQAYARRLDEEYCTQNPGDFAGSVEYIRKKLHEKQVKESKPVSKAEQRKELRTPDTVPSKKIVTSKSDNNSDWPKDMSVFTEGDIEMAKRLHRNKQMTPKEYLESIRELRQ